MNPPVLRFHQVVKRYDGNAVLDHVDLDIAAGECVALVGINGAGKTSLLKCLFDLVARDAGNIDIFGRSHRQSAARAPLSFLPERLLPPYYLSGREFLTYLLTLQGIAYDAERAGAMLASGQVTDPRELAILARRLEQLKAKDQHRQ